MSKTNNKNSNNNNEGMFHIVGNPKGGVGKSTVSEAVASALYSNYLSKITILQIDDFNKECNYEKSKIVKVESLNIDKGLKKTDSLIFDVLNEKQNVVIDCGGGHDTDKIIDSMINLHLEDNYTFYIPVLKDKSGMINLLNTYHKIRKNLNSKIIIILNQTNSNDWDEIKEQFIYLFGNKSIGINGIAKEFEDDDNVEFAHLRDTVSFDVANNLNLTVWELGNNKFDIKNYLKEALNKGQKSFENAKQFVTISNICKELKDNVLDQFAKIVND